METARPVLVRRPGNIHPALQGQRLSASRSSPYVLLLRWPRRRVAELAFPLAASSPAKPPVLLVETTQLSSPLCRWKHKRNSPRSPAIPVSSIVLFALGDPSPTSSPSGR